MDRLACWSIVVMLVVNPWCEVSPSAQVATEIGTWTLDVARSKFPGGSGPKSRTLTIENSGQGVKVSNLTVAADGRISSSSYTEIFDGREYPLAGSANAITASSRRIDTNTGERITKTAGKVTRTRLRMLSADGQTLTVTEQGTNGEGQPFGLTMVFQRQ